MNTSSYEGAYGTIRLDRETAELVQCTCRRRSGCDGCRLELGLERFSELLYRLGWQLEAVSRQGIAVEKLPPPKPWAPEPWQQGFPGPLFSHHEECSGRHITNIDDGKMCVLERQRRCASDEWAGL